MIATVAARPEAALRVDPTLIAAVAFLRRGCSVNDIATILGCDRKRVLTALARLRRAGLPVTRSPAAPPYRPLTRAQQLEVTMLANNGRGLDFYALCRVLCEVHPLAIFVFLRAPVGPRHWWVRPCAACGTPFATPSSAFRLCEDGCGARRKEAGIP